LEVPSNNQDTITCNSVSGISNNKGDNMSEAEKTLQTIKIYLKDNQYPAYDSIGVGRSIIKDIENIIQNKETV